MLRHSRLPVVLRRPSTSLTLLLLVGLPCTLRGQVRPCNVPVGYSATFRDFRPPTDLGAAVASYQDCVVARGAEVLRDPFAGIYEQQRLDTQANFLLRVGRQVIGWLPYADVLNAYEYVHTSGELTPQIRQGLEQRFTAYAARYQAARSAGGGSASLAAARELLVEWNALKGQLEQAVPAIRDEKTAALVRKQIVSGDGLALSLLLDAVQQAGISRDSARQTLAAAGIGSGEEAFREVRSRLDVITRELGARAAERDSAKRAAEGAEQVQRIGEYGAFAHSMLGVAAYAGLMSPRDAQTMQGVVAGATQIATAVALVQAGTAASALGPYGMAVAGGLTIASAVQGSGTSQTAQLAGMLRQISQQIAALQRSVDAGFANLSTQLGETEQRIMSRLSVVLQQTDLIILGQEKLRAEVRAVREVLVRQAEDARVTANLEFARLVPYHDRRCLRSFGWFGGKDREECLAAYGQLVQDFTTRANASLVGAPTRPLRSDASAHDQYAALIAEGARLTGQGSPLDAVHGPTLTLIEDRVRLFLTRSPKVANEPAAQAMLAQLDELRARHDRAEGALLAPATRAAARSAYAAELARLIERIDRRSAQFVDTATITSTDVVHLTEVRNALQPAALRHQAQRFPAAGPGLAGLVPSPLHPELALGTAAEGFGPQALLRDKLTAFTKAIRVKDSVSYVVSPEALRGYVWVQPCNTESPFYPFPLRRDSLAKALGGEVVALSAAGRGMFRLCYTPSVENTSGAVVSVHNSNYRTDVLWARVASVFPKPMEFCGGLIGGHYGPGRVGHYVPGRARQYFVATYLPHPEFSASSWESCHHGHVHHELFTRSRQLNGATFQLDVDLPGYRSATRTFTVAQPLPTDAYDRCLLPVDVQNGWNPASVFAPYLLQYPLAVSKPCQGVDGLLALSLPELRRQLGTFLDSSGTTRRIGDPQGTEIGYRAALQEVLRARRNANYEAYLTAILGPESEYAALDQLHAFQLALNALQAPPATAGDEISPAVADAIPRHLGGRDLRTYLATMLHDPVTGTLTTAAAIAPTIAGAPPVTATLAPPPSAPKGLRH